MAEKYRLITTLTDHRAFPAAALVRLYHERWETESAFLALRHTLLAGRVLRSGDRPGIEQELWALVAAAHLPAHLDTRQSPSRQHSSAWRLLARGPLPPRRAKGH